MSLGTDDSSLTVDQEIYNITEEVTASIPPAVEEIPVCSIKDSLTAHQPSSLITFSDLSYEYHVSKSRYKCFPCMKRNQESVQVLHRLKGILKPGLNAIMGPSGSGKSTLLNILAGRVDSAGLHGTILFNARPYPKHFSKFAGYIVQSDIILETLTVKENIWFSANLRLPCDEPHSVKKTSIEAILHQLALESCQDSIISKGVSGGEKKRTAIAMELITRPKILFLDEPTSSLDASTAQAVLALLKRLSYEGHNIVLSIHQPRWSIFRLFDTLTLLTHGRMLYHGDATQAVPYFNDIGYICGERSNPADHFLDVISGHADIVLGRIESEDDVLTGEAALNHVERLASIYRKSAAQIQIVREMQSEISIERWDRKEQKGQNSSVPFHYQLKYLSKRALKILTLNPSAVISDVGLNFIIGVVFGLVYMKMGEFGHAAIYNRLGLLFVICSNVMFGSLSTIELFAHGQTLFLHEVASNYYCVSSYFLSKIFVELLPVKTLSSLAFLITVYWMSALQPDADAFFICLLTLFLLQLSAIAIGAFFSVACNNPPISTIFTSLTFVLSLLFSGLLINVGSMAPWISWLKHISISRYGFVALCINELRYKTFHSCALDSQMDDVIKHTSPHTHLNKTELCELIRGEKTLRSHLSVDTDGSGNIPVFELWKNHIALMLIAFSFLLFTYVRLLFLTRRR